MQTLMAQIMTYLRAQALGKVNGACFFTIGQVAEAIGAETHRVDYCICQLIERGTVRRDFGTGRSYLMFMEEPPTPRYCPNKEVDPYKPTVHQQRVYAFVEWCNKNGYIIVETANLSTGDVDIWDMAGEFIASDLFTMAEEDRYEGLYYEPN